MSRQNFSIIKKISSICLFLFVLALSVRKVDAVQTTIGILSDGEGTYSQMAADMNQLITQNLSGSVNAVTWLGDIGYNTMGTASSSVAYGVGAYATSTLGANGIPLFLAVGNHEAENASDIISLRQMYSTYLGYATTSVHGPQGWNFSQMPNAFASTTNYAYDIGDVRVIVVNQYSATSSDAVNTVGRIHNLVFDWIKSEIKKTTKKTIAVMAHEPAYPVPSQVADGGGNHIGDALDLDPANRDKFVNLLASYGNVNHFAAHTHYADLYEMRNNSTTRGDARNTVTTLDGGLWELDAGAFGTKASTDGVQPSIAYLKTNSSAYGDYSISLVQKDSSSGWTTPTRKTVGMKDLSRHILVNTWDGSGTGTSSNGLFDMKYYVDYTAAVEANPDWSSNNSGKWWEPGFNPDTAGWTAGEMGVGYKTGGTRPRWINTPINAFGGLATTTEQVHGIMQRVTFPATTTASYSAMTLGLDVDDGIMAWLNGTLILNTTTATVTPPTTGNGSEYFDKTQSGFADAWVGATTTPVFTNYDVSEFKSALVDGENTLVIWNINSSTNSSDLGVAARLSMNGAFDDVPPVITSVASTAWTPSTAQITWSTDEAANSYVEYGLTSSYTASSTFMSALTTSHIAQLSGLATTTTYHYRVVSSDSSGNRANSSDYTVTTPSVVVGTSTISFKQGTNGYIGTTDTYINESAATTNYGSATSVTVDGAGPFANGLLKWDLSAIPSYATVSDVKLVYNVTDNSGTSTYSVYRSLKPWTENGATWNTYDGTNAWGAIGSLDSTTDYNSTALGTISKSTTGFGTSTLNSSGIATVQGWIDGSFLNNGFMVTKTTGADIDGFVFASKDSLTAANRPALVVTYNVPAGPDTVAPVIQSVASSTTGTTATITWTTNEAATTSIQYGLTTSYGSSTAITSIATTTHSTTLTGLTSSTVYHFKINAYDSTGNQGTSSDYTFTTPLVDNTAPIISSISASSTSGGGIITWTTNENANTRVVYGTSSGAYTASSTSATFETSHTVTLGGLPGLTQYYYRVVSADASGNTATSSENSFTTGFSTAPSYEVYIDVGNGNPPLGTKLSTVPNVMNFGKDDGASTSTIKFSDGTATGVTLTITADGTSSEGTGPEDGTAAEDGTSGTRGLPIYPTIGTDAYNEFGTKVNIGGNTNSSINGATLYFTFTGLDTNKKYTFVSNATRGRYNNRFLRTQILGASSATNQSSVGTVATTTGSLANDSTIYNGGGNYANGYVAKWIDVDPATTTIIIAAKGVAFGAATANSPYMNAIKFAEQSDFVADVAAPVITSIASTTGTSTAHITWNTNEAASSSIQYGLTTSYGTVASSSAATSHVVDLTGLTASTTYYYRVVARDASGNTSTSSDQTFVTAASLVTDTTAPVISAIASSTASSTAHITWMTNEIASSSIRYGLTTSYGTVATSTATSSHVVDLSGLTPDTVYHYQVLAIDPSGNISTSSDQTFRTAVSFVPDTTAPVISSIASSTGITSALVTWSTNENASSSIRYGLTSSYGTVASSSATTSHSVSLSGLTANTTYHYQVLAIDTSGNISTSTDQIFKTAASGAVGYEVYVDVGNGTPPLATKLSTEPNVMNFGKDDGASTSTIKFGDGTSTGVTLTITSTDPGAQEGTGPEDGTAAEDGSSGTRGLPIYPVNGTDAYNEFGTKVNIGGNTNSGLGNSTLFFTFTGLDTSKKYTLVSYATRGKYNNRFLKTYIAGASSFLNESSAGTVATTTSVVGDSVIYNAGGNYNNGYIAKWVNVDPATTTITIAARSIAFGGASANSSYMNALKLVEQTEFVPDTTAPAISGIASTTASSTAHITWNTDEAASSSVQYGLTTSYGTVASSTATSSHVVDLAGLATNTTYHYQVIARDSSGNTSTSSDQIFTTGTAFVPDTTAPIISGIATSTGTSTAQVTWSTNESASSSIQYGLTTAYGTVASSTATSSHVVNIFSLTPNTTYHYRVIARDASGNTSTSSDQTFLTTAILDTTAPVISAIASSTASSSAQITWSTNEVASSSVRYGLTTSYGTVASSTGTTSHAVTVLSLASNTTYHYQVLAVDTSGNIATSSDQTFTTQTFIAPDTQAPLISSIASSVSTTTATVTWTTNEAATTSIAYGLTSSYGSVTATTSVATTTHSQTITGLTHSTLYHFKINAYDAAGNAGSSTDQTFTTDVFAPADATPPIISSVASSTASTSASIAFVTNENSYALVRYGTTTAYGATTTLSAVATSSHIVLIAGLIPSTLYHFQVWAYDTTGNLGSTTDRTFTTTADNVAPQLSAIAAVAGSNSANLTWTTDEFSSSQAQYGLSPLYGSTTAKIDISPRVLSHTVQVTNLASCAMYHFRVISQDAAGNTSTSTDQEFVTENCAGESTVGATEEAQISNSTGGTLASLDSGNGIALEAPAGYSTSSAYFQILELNTSSVIAEVGLPAGLKVVNGYMFRLNALANANTLITSFSQPITITMSYNDSDVTGIIESSLVVYRHDGTSWFALSACTVDTIANTVTCSTTNFSDFSLFGTESPTAGPSYGGGSTSGGGGGGGGGGWSSTTIPPVVTVTGTSTVTTATGATTTATTTLVMPVVPKNFKFVKQLKLGITNSDVLILQKILNADPATRIALIGAGSIGKETNFFGALTKKAVTVYQVKYKIIKNAADSAAGLVGPATRGRLNLMLEGK